MGPLGKRYLGTSMPALCEDNNCGQAAVRNWAADYADGQDAIKQRNEQRQKELASGTLEAALRAANSREREQPDGPEVFQTKWRAMRDEAMAQLQAALLALLRQALSYRGRIEFPVDDHAPAAAEAAPRCRPAGGVSSSSLRQLVGSALQCVIPLQVCYASCCMPLRCEYMRAAVPGGQQYSYGRTAAFPSQEGNQCLLNFWPPPAHSMLVHFGMPAKCLQKAHTANAAPVVQPAA